MHRRNRVTLRSTVLEVYTWKKRHFGICGRVVKAVSRSARGRPYKCVFSGGYGGLTVDHAEHASIWFIDGYVLWCMHKTGAGVFDTMRN